MTNLYSLIAGKSDRSDRSQWLPNYMHAEDTAGIIVYLCLHWLPAAVAEIFAPLSVEAFTRVSRFVALVHEIGKITLHFQSLISETIDGHKERLADAGLHLPDCKEKLKHAQAGEVILRDLGCPDGIAAVVGAHHGVTQPNGLKPCVQFDKSYMQYFGRQEYEWRSLWEACFHSALTACGYASAAELPSRLSMPQQMVLTGLLIMADWIASNPRYFPLIPVESIGSTACYPERVRQAWEAVNLPDPLSPDGFGMDDKVFSTRFDFAPKKMQRQAMDIANNAEKLGLMVIEAQMGLGKTEAALAVAEIAFTNRHCGGIFFGLPTQATANGIFPRVIKWAKRCSEGARSSVILAHAMAEFNEDYRELFHEDANTDEDAGLVIHDWFRGRKRALLCDFVIGTVDQLLMAALIQKHVMLRHLGLAGKVVIVDEVHAYDAYMSRYLERALSWLGAYETPVILLSATLPAARREALVKDYLGKGYLKEGDWRKSRAYPLITWTDSGEVFSAPVEADAESRTVKIKRIKDSERLDVLADCVADGGCACVIANTVRRAQELATAVEAAIPDAEVVLFHAQFVMPDRAELERRLLRRLGKDAPRGLRDKLIVIGTQVLEQSLDIDFDVMLTDLCPIDLLLQRIGRLQRFRFFDALRPERLKQATCYVVGEPDALEDGAEAIYGKWLLTRTRQLLPEYISLPDSIPELVQEVYDEDKFTEEKRAAREQYKTKRDNARSRADVYCIDKPAKECEMESFDLIDGLMNNVEADLSDRQAQASVRDGDPSIEVLLLMEKEGQVCFLPWQNGGAAVFSDGVPSMEEQRRIAQQRIRLPHIFCVNHRINKTIQELETRTKRFGEWQQAALLREELVLLLDVKLTTELCGYNVLYSMENGLICKENKKK